VSSPHPRTDALIGKKIGNYTVEQRLGQGGMGAVYLVRHVRLNSLAALKVLGDGAFGTDAAANLRERFEQEALAAAAVDNHRVVKPLDLGELEDGTPYILMEYVPGKSLAQELLEGGPMNVLRALKIAYRIADAMAAVHAAGITHRDLKPQNIMLVRQGTGDPHPKILDFGVARASGKLRLVQTTERTVIGTPGYMSPEATAGLPTDGRTDVFSLGVILYEMLCGCSPFSTESAQAAIMSVLTLDAATVASRRPAALEPIPPSVEALVARALVKEPSNRPAMAEFARAVGEALAGLPPSDSGKVQNALATVLSVGLLPELAPSDKPTLSSPAGEVAAMVDRLQGRPAPSSELRPPTLAAGPAALASSPRAEAVTPKLAGAPRSRRLWLVVFAGAFVVVGCVSYLVARSVVQKRAEREEAGRVEEHPAAPPEAPVAKPPPPVAAPPAVAPASPPVVEPPPPVARPPVVAPPPPAAAPAEGTAKRKHHGEPHERRHLSSETPDPFAP
jgi:serine/threonine-protein kinase